MTDGRQSLFYASFCITVRCGRAAAAWLRSSVAALLLSPVDSCGITHQQQHQLDPTALLVQPLLSSWPASCSICAGSIPATDAWPDLLLGLLLPRMLGSRAAMSCTTRHVPAAFLVPVQGQSLFFGCCLVC